MGIGVTRVSTMTYSAEFENCCRSADRRKNVMKAAIYATFKKRRKNIRRNTDSIHDTYVDSMDSSVFTLAIVAMGLCICDAFFTTILLQNGSSELNPVMDMLLGYSLEAFLALKFSLTGMSSSLLVLHKHHRLLQIVNGYQLLWACVAGYLILVTYELSMIQHLILT